MKKTTKAKKAKKAKKVENEVVVSLKLGNEVYTASAHSVSEALASIRPLKINLKGLFTITGHGLKYETQMFPQQVKRLLFGSDTVRELFEKNSLIDKKYV